MNKKKVLLQGSLAYDHLLKFNGKFQRNLTPDKFISNVFLAEDKRIHFGGCGGNIAYGFSQLDVDFDLYGVLGQLDSDTYEGRLHSLGISTDRVKIFNDEHTAVAYICTDAHEQQLTFFYPGPKLNGASEGVFSFNNEADYGLALIAPNTSCLMVEAFRFAQDNDITIMFDPGQQIPDLDTEFLREALSASEFVVVNSSECELLMKYLELEMSELVNLMNYLIVTDGPNSTCVYRDGASDPILVPVEKVDAFTDPTGCGDAFRAGFIKRFLDGDDIEDCVKFGHEVARLAIGVLGPQDYLVL